MMLDKAGSKMRLTIEQRLAALERENVVLHDTTKLLHRMLKEQRQLINDYITQRVISTNRSGEQEETRRPEDALYTFVCRQRFEGIEQHMQALRNLAQDPKSGLKAG